MPTLQLGAPTLTYFVALPDRDTAIAQAYASGVYSLKEIADAFGLHYATISRVVRRSEGAVLQGKV